MSNTINSQFPELMAIHGALDAQFLVRQQWVGFEGRPETANLNISGYIHPIRSAFGIVVERDALGQVRSDRLQFGGTHRIKVGERIVLSPAIALDYSDMSIPDYFSWPTERHSIYQRFRLVSGVSVILDKNYYLAMNYRNVVDHAGYAVEAGWFNDALDVRDRFSALLGGNFTLGKFILTPQALIRTDFSTSSTRISLTGERNGLIVGTAFEPNDRWVIALGYEYKEWIRLTYSYDSTANRLSSGSAGSHEIGLRAILFKGKSKREFVRGLGLI